MKPVESGCERLTDGLLPHDGLFLKEMSASTDDVERIVPYRLEHPLTPSVAAELEGVVIDLAVIQDAYQQRAAQYDLMLQKGFDPEVELDYYAIPRGAYKHEKVIYSVYFGEYDAASAPVLDLEVMTKMGKISADDFRILAQSDIIPYCTFGAAKNVDAELAAAFRKALLELTPETTVSIDGQDLKVLDAAWIDGFEVLLDSDYDVIRDMAKRANMPPYQEF
jgi:hypothetical protein